MRGTKFLARSRRCIAASSSTDDASSSSEAKEATEKPSRSSRDDGESDWSHVTADWLFDSLIDDLRYLDDFERSEIYHATTIAFKAHDGQKRKSGEPFITHPVAVAQILAQQKMDHETVIAGLLHDTVEDTDLVTFESIQERFGPAVRRIVEGETKVSKVSSSVSKKTNLMTESGVLNEGGVTKNDENKNSASTPVAAAASQNVQADDLQQMFLAMTQEVRVIIVKLADRLHNMRTLGSLKPEKRVKISRETLLVFAPLAKLLGMYQVKNELEDLAFRWSAPDEHAETARWFDELSKRQEPTVRRAANELRALCESDPFLRSSCARVEVIPRAKELYGVYRKSEHKKKERNAFASHRGANSNEDEPLEERLRSVNEVAQLRVVLELDESDHTDGGSNGVSSRVCYHALGLVHERWPPVPGRVNDYIATPKLNGYRALHTVVLPIGATDEDFGSLDTETSKLPDQVFPIELQIRTGAMHRMAESGIVADPEVKGAWRAMARRSARRLRRTRDANSSTSSESESAFVSLDADSDSDDDADDVSAEDSVLIRSGHARQVAWLSNIREWQEEFLGVLTAEEFVDTITGDLLGRRVFVFTPSGGVMNLPHGSTVVDFAFYTDAGLDAVRCTVNGARCDFGQTLKNADVVEISRAGCSDDPADSQRLGTGTYGLELSGGGTLGTRGGASGTDDADALPFGMELLGGAGEASAAAVASAARKHSVATQKRFLTLARTRSARAKIKKFLAENGALEESLEAVQETADRGADEDTIDREVFVTEEVREAARLFSATATGDAASASERRRRFSGARVSLRCVDKDGLLREISSVLSAIEGCSIVGYAGESSGQGEFLMTYTIVLDTPKKTDFVGSRDQASAELTVMDIDARLRALFKALSAHDRVLDVRLFCKCESSRGSGDPFTGA